MITIITSPVGGSGVSMTAVLLSLWLREVAPSVRLIDLSHRGEDSPAGSLGVIPRLDVFRASTGAPSAAPPCSIRAFTSAWLRAQRSLNFATTSIATVVDLPQVFATWAWSTVVSWLTHGTGQIHLILLLPPCAQSAHLLRKLPTQVAPAVTIMHPEWMQGSRQAISSSPDRSRLLDAGARELFMPSLAWGSVADTLAVGVAPIVPDAAASFIGRLQLRAALERVAVAFSGGWPAPDTDAPSRFAIQWSQLSPALQE